MPYLHDNIDRPPASLCTSTQRAGVWRAAALFALVTSLSLGLAACAGKRAATIKPDQAAGEAQTFDHPTLVRQPGKPIVVWREAAGWMSGTRAARVQDDKAGRVPAKAWWFPASPDDSSWVGAADWSTPLAEGTRGAGSGLGFWAVVLEPTPAATTLRVGDRTWFILDAANLPASPSPRATPDHGLSDLLQPALTDPLLRWRAHALVGSSRSFQAPLLEALASQVEVDWSAALERLAASDPAVAAQVHDRLLLTAHFHESMGAQHAPVWTGDLVRDLRLLESLLSDRPMARVQAANAWLGDEPSAISWVVDDAGLYGGADAQAVWTIAVANLTQAQVIATAGSPDRPSDPRAIDARSVVLLFRGDRRLPSARNDNDPSGSEDNASAAAFAPTNSATPLEPERVAVRAGAARQVHDIACVASPIGPPGARIGPFLSDWTRSAWLNAQSVSLPDSTWQTAAMLYRDDRVSSSATPDLAWHLLIECRMPTGTKNPREALRVWLGPSTSESAVIQISTDADARAEIGSGAAAEAARNTIVRIGPDRWWARVPIPSDAIDAAGTLRVGLERLDAKGRRTAWPRPMLPWQLEPARAAFDLRHWQGALGTSRAGDAPPDAR